MDTTLQAPQHITSIATSAILVSAHNSVWTGSVTDKKTRNEIAATKGADEEAVEFTKKLLAKCPEHKALMRFRQTINNGMKVYTYPWAGGIDVLPMVRYDKFMQWWDDRVAEHTGLRNAFKTIYPDFVSNLAFGSTGVLFDRNEYPSVDDIDNRFTLTLHKSPVPMNDFRVQVSQSLADDLHKHYVSQTEDFAKRIVDEQVSQFVKVMQSLHHSCGFETLVDSNGNTKIKRRKVVETTLEKALEMCDTFRKFNPTQSQDLEDARVALEQLLENVDITALRESDSMRARVGGEVTTILNKFKVKA